MNMFEAIYSRKSVRRFKQEKVDWSIIEDILKFADNLPMLTGNNAVEFKLVSSIEKKQGFRGPLAVKAPYYICISSEKGEDYLLNVGYLMQQLNLYITSKGLGVCFMGLANPGRALKATMKYDYVIALAFGKASEPLYRDSKDAKRLPESKTVIYKEEVAQDIHQILSAAQLSPSHYNNQPWRFVVYKNRIHVFTRKNSNLIKVMDINNKIDIGAMMANIMVAAEELWVDVSLSKSDSLKNKQLQNNSYVLSVIIG
jgi:nitroreductase